MGRPVPADKANRGAVGRRPEVKETGQEVSEGSEERARDPIVLRTFTSPPLFSPRSQWATFLFLTDDRET